MPTRVRPKTPKPPKPEPTPEPTPPQPAPSNLAPLPISTSSPYLDIGDYPEKAWQESLAANSPLRSEIAAIVKASAGTGILAREQALKESSDGTDSTARQTRNPLGLMVRSTNEPYIVTGSGRKLRVFNSWSDAFAEHHRRLTDPQEAYQSVGVKTLGQFIERYLMGWTPGSSNHPFPPGETQASLDQYKQQLVTRINQRIETYGRVGDGAPQPQPQPGGIPEGFRAWDIPGLPQKMVLPDTITVEVILTPKGVHRPGRIISISGATLHETGNQGVGAGARMHSNWQDSCTPGHPDGYVGVSIYVENRLVLIKIPLNENSIHSGDWRNDAHTSTEICVNADRNAQQTEDTAMWVQAAMLAARGLNAKDNLYPHHTTGCPAIINGQGRWPQIEKGVDDRIAILKQGGSLPPTETYAEAVPVPKEWDGTDYLRDDGQVFMALQRVFVTTKATAARQSANPSAPKVRRDLPKGEAFLSHYVTQGSDGKAWLVSQFGSRILADDCAPKLNSFDIVAAHADQAPWFPGNMILTEGDRGLSADPTPVGSKPVPKDVFMRGDRDSR